MVAVNPSYPPHLGDAVDAGVVGGSQTLVQFKVLGVIFASGKDGGEAIHRGVRHAQGLLQTLFKGAANGHHL